MDQSPQQQTHDIELMRQLDRYFPEKLRVQIEQNYYAKVNEQARLDCVARNEEFLSNPLNHVALFSDHGVVHVRDVATNIIPFLDASNGVLIPSRDTLHLEFMKGYGIMLAYNHDIGMMDFSTFGRAMHPEFAAQEVFNPAYDKIVNTIWTENCGNVAWRLVNLVETGALDQDPKLVLREMLAMSVGHSKSKVPIDVLNNPAQLREVMLTTISTNLHHLYHDQQVTKAAEKLARALDNTQKPDKTEGQISLREPTIIQSLGTKKSELRQALNEAKANRETFLQTEAGANRTYEEVLSYFEREATKWVMTDQQDMRQFVQDYFSREAFKWLVSDDKDIQALVSDVIDTIRILRVADALRQRGTVLKTSAGYQIFVDQNTANAVFGLQKGSGEMFMLESSNPLSAGEANIGSSELTSGGNLRLSFHRGAFANQEMVRRSAYHAAVVIDDIQRDIVDTFRRPPGVNDQLKDNQDIQILIEETDDNLEFADMILAELKTINPELENRSRIVPSLKYISLDERKRYLAATELDWSFEEKEKVLVRVAQSGHKIHNIDPERAFTDVRLTSLREGEILILAGAPPGFVYVPMGEGLLSTPLGGYQAHSVKPWIPLGNTRVIRGDVQEATITAEQELKVLMIPKEIYLKYWHDTYNIQEFSQLLPRVYAEDKMKGLEQILNILQQVALIDKELDDAEVAFIQKFTEAYGLDYSAVELREKLLAGGESDFVGLRQSVLDYLAVDPPYLQVGQLRDLLNLFVKADEEITEEEALILAELNGLFASYLDEDTGQSPYRVWIVPQSPEQDDAVTSLLPDLPKEEIAGGFAYFVGSYYSQDYADMICDKYRTLQFFTFVDQKNGKEI